MFESSILSRATIMALNAIGERPLFQSGDLDSNSNRATKFMLAVAEWLGA